MSPSCADGAPLPGGAACGSGRVCDGAGACIACSEGMACSTNAGECFEGKVSCAAGASACVDAAPRVAGTPCGQAQQCDGQGSCLAPACDDGLKNGPETDVDCGGSCPKCDEQKACGLPADCKSGVCSSGICQAPSCTDGVTNGAETDVDCGGSCPQRCADALHCTAGGDCQSAVCVATVCQTPSCSDAVRNGAETDSDCGGTCPAKCADQQGCDLGADCQSAVCLASQCQAPTCTDGAHNGPETDVDCGGSCPLRCIDQQHCATAGDCQSGVCSGNACQSPTCSDGVRNGAESDLDCGGVCLAKCLDGAACAAAADCKSGVCALNVCQPSSCTDGVRNGSETDLDCGGGCPQGCGDTLRCAMGGDCQSGVCASTVCQTPTCADLTKNGPETDVDCGGTCAASCADGKGCAKPADCKSGVCLGSVCQSPSCTDATANGSETDVDCGGSCPNRCPAQQHCALPADCQSGVCSGGVCQGASCTDGVKNGTETDLDCGGPCTTKCADAKGCAAPGDCVSGVCTTNVCQAPSCTDAVANGSETDVDCGGSCPTHCADNQGCAAGGDCQSGVCSMQKCAQATCTDLVKNGAETDVDCGGACTAKCADAKGCALPSDCESGVCTGGVCQVPSCTDLVQNAAETDVDCGGGTCVRCGAAKKCAAATDCLSGVCGATNTCSAPSCTDHVKNGTEDAVDCGGACPLSCDPSLYAPPIDPTVATDLYDSFSFLTTGPNAVQKGVTAAFNPVRFTVLRGRVVDTALQPLPGVTVRVAGHPEWGYTLSRADGVYDFCVDGGGVLTLTFTAPGMLSADRHADAPWHDFVQVPDVALVALDPNATPVSFTAPITVARGSVVTDKDGTRQATVFFPQGTVATMKFLDGGASVLPTATVRITEYTVGDAGEAAMPGELPPTSAYTYASEFSVDEAMNAGAWRVDFSKNVIGYLDNFLQMPVGLPVPNGTYDPRFGAWTPEADGRVVKIVSVTGGLANLDLDGGGNAAPLAVLSDAGITDPERAQLASLYTPGKTLWRMPMSHFSPGDWNWPYGFPPGATPPNAPPPDIDGPQPPCTKPGCDIEVQNQVLGDDVPIQGTPFTLHYGSDRVIGRDAARTIDLQITSTSINPQVQEVAVIFAIAGQYAEYHYGPNPPSHVTWTWNGYDNYGRRLQGPQHATVRVGYAYRPFYHGGDLSGSGSSFGSFGNLDTSKGSRGLIWSWQTQKVTLQGMGGLDYRGQGFGGWSFSEQHIYSSSERTLFLGGGGQRTRDRFGANITTVMSGASIDDMVPLADGAFYVLWAGTHELRRYDPATGAMTALVPNVYSRIALARDGTVYSAHDYGLERLLPTRQTIIPFGTMFSFPDGFGIKPDGTVLVGGGNCSATQTVLSVLPNGAQRTMSLPNPTITLGNECMWNLTTAPNGDVLYGGRGAIRRALTDGSNKVFAGMGGCNFCGFAGDGVPATSAQLQDSLRFVVDRDGTGYLSDSCSIRVVDTQGIIRNLAGSGSCTVGNPADGIAARDAVVNASRSIAIHPSGDLYFVDTGTARLRKISPALPGYSRFDTFMPNDQGSQVFHFDRNGRHIETLDALSQLVVLKFAYDGAGRLVTVTDADGNVTQITRDAAGNATAIKAPGGQVTTLAYDAAGYLQSVTDAAGRVTTLGYVGNGLLASRSFGGATHAYGYDAVGRLASVTDPTGVTKTITRSRAGTTTTWSYAVDGGTTTTYEAQDLVTGGRIRRARNGLLGLTASTEPLSGTGTLALPDLTTQSTTQAPDPRWGFLAPITSARSTTLPDSGTVITTTLSRNVVLDGGNPLAVLTLTDTIGIGGASWVSSWTTGLRRSTFTTPAGHVTTNDYDSKGHLVRVQRDTAITSPITLTWNANGTPASVGQGPLSVSYGYDARRRPISATDATGAVTTFEYDLADHRSAVVLPGTARYGFAYDSRGNLASVTMPTGAAHVMGYDPSDRFASYAPPGGLPSTVTYGANGKPMLFMLANGKAISQLYDLAERVTHVAWPEATVDATYVGAATTYATLTRTPVGGGSPHVITLANDGPRVKAYVQSGSSNGAYTFSYDSAGRVSALSLDGAAASARTRDADGRIVGYGPFTLTRGVSGKLSTALNGAAQVLNVTYDGLGRELSKATRASSEMFRYTLSYDNAGRIAHKVDSLSNGATIHTYDYGYDADGKLLTVTRDGVTAEQYAYDVNGNRISAQAGGASVASTFDARDALINRGSTGYAYDGEGFLTTRGSDTFAYSARGELLSATIGGVTVTYDYDAVGHRVARTDASGTTQYLYAGLGDLQPTHTRSPAGVVTEYFYDDNGRLLGLVRQGAVYVVATDQVGTPRRVIDSAGAIVLDVEYDAWGNVVSGDPDAFELPIGFAGGLRDPLTGLVRFGARDYEPASGRWTARDPQLFSGGFNLYAYGSNSPVMFVDRSGAGPNTPGSWQSPGGISRNNAPRPMLCDGGGPPPSVDPPPPPEPPFDIYMAPFQGGPSDPPKVIVNPTPGGPPLPSVPPPPPEPAIRNQDIQADPPGPKDFPLPMPIPNQPTNSPPPRKIWT